MLIICSIFKVQILYAADDAIMSFYVFCQCIYHRNVDHIDKVSINEFGEKTNASELISFDIDQFISNQDITALDICTGIIDVKVIKLEAKINRKRKREESKSGLNGMGDDSYDREQERLRKKEERKKLYRERASRQKPLYENCRLLDLNGNLIANCSAKTIKVCCTLNETLMLLTNALFSFPIHSGI